MVRWTLRNATRNIAVSRALSDEMTRLGASPEKMAVIGNGVDEKRFHLLDRAEARQALDELEATWRGRVERMSNLLATGGSK